MRLFSTIIVAFGMLGTALIAPSTVLAQTPGNVYVHSLNHAGSGCPAGSVSQSISADLKAFRLSFDSLIAEVGPGVPISATRKNCQISVDLRFPSGWSFAVQELDVRGFVSIELGVTANESVSYYFTGMGATARLSTTMRGPMSRNYVLRDTLGLSALVWSPCALQRPLNLSVSVQARVDNGGNSGRRGIVTVDSVGAARSHNYGLVWRRC